MMVIKFFLSSWSSQRVINILDFGKAGRVSIRTEQWPYTKWDEGNAGTELYDYKTDLNELTNLASRRMYKEMVQKLSAQLKTLTGQ